MKNVFIYNGIEIPLTYEEINVISNKYHIIPKINATVDLEFEKDKQKYIIINNSRVLASEVEHCIRHRYFHNKHCVSCEFSVFCVNIANDVCTRYFEYTWPAYDIQEFYYKYYDKYSKENKPISDAVKDWNEMRITREVGNKKDDMSEEEYQKVRKECWNGIKIQKNMEVR